MNIYSSAAISFGKIYLFHRAGWPGPLFFIHDYILQIIAKCRHISECTIRICPFFEDLTMHEKMYEIFEHVRTKKNQISAVQEHGADQVHRFIAI